MSELRQLWVENKEECHMIADQDAGNLVGRGPVDVLAKCGKLVKMRSWSNTPGSADAGNDLKRCDACLKAMDTVERQTFSLLMRRDRRAREAFEQMEYEADTFGHGPFSTRWD